jgi:hypothetical protein
VVVRAGEVEAAGAVVGNRAKQVNANLTRGNTLDIELIPARPHQFVLCFAIRTNSGLLDFFSQSCGSYGSHSPLTGRTSENLLHDPSLLSPSKKQ